MSLTLMGCFECFSMWQQCKMEHSMWTCNGVSCCGVKSVPSNGFCLYIKTSSFLGQNREMGKHFCAKVGIQQTFPCKYRKLTSAHLRYSLFFSQGPMLQKVGISFRPAFLI